MENEKDDKKREKSRILRVAEAYHRDAWRWIARIDAETIRALGLIPGDVIEIEGRSVATAIVHPAYSDDSGKSIIRIDDNLRNNAGAAIDDKVKVKQTKAKEAKRITLAPTQPIRITGGERYLLSKLINVPITKGEIITFELLGNPVTFAVTNTVPLGRVIPNIDTELVLRKTPEEKTGYEDIGGLKREIGLIREMIELPFRHPELFERLGIEPPKSVLLYGPKGTGKTLIANAIETETVAYFQNVSGHDLICRDRGDEDLQKIFERAEKKKPSIIFIDDLDSIAPKVGEITYESERRILVRFQYLMDRLKLYQQVVVIGATNRLDALNEDLRGLGIFDREIKIGVPNKKVREEILQIHTREMPLADDVDLKEIVYQTIDFVGAEIAELCREAAMHALRNIQSAIDIESDIPPEIIEQLTVSKPDFIAALKIIKKRKHTY